jgi:hypothetical protein
MMHLDFGCLMISGGVGSARIIPGKAITGIIIKERVLRFTLSSFVAKLRLYGVLSAL